MKKMKNFHLVMRRSCSKIQGSRGCEKTQDAEFCCICLQITGVAVEKKKKAGHALRRISGRSRMSAGICRVEAT